MTARLVPAFLLCAAALTACQPVPPEWADGGPDGGTDSGPPDSGPPDSGPPDSGPPDGGVPDGGMVGPLDCGTSAHDPVLGTAALGAGFKVVDWAAVPTDQLHSVGVKPEARADGSTGLGVFGYLADGRVHRLGSWPELALPDAGSLLFDAIAPSDRSLEELVPALPIAHEHLIAGYRKLHLPDGMGGAVALFDSSRPERGVKWLQAPGLESVLGLGSFLLAGASGLGKLDDTAGVYAVKYEESELVPTLVATLPSVPGENLRPGLMAVTTHGVLVLGYADSHGRQYLRIPPPPRVAQALLGGAPFAIGSGLDLTSADVANVAGFGHGVAVLHTQKSRGVLPALGRLKHFPLDRLGDFITVRSPGVVLSADDACTGVSQLVPAGANLIVGLQDRNGQRLVRLAPR